MWGSCQRYQPMKRALSLTNQFKHLTKQPLRPTSASLHVFAKRKDKDVVDPYSSVRPAEFWIDRMLESEEKKPLTGGTSKPRKLIEKTMKDSYTEKYLKFKQCPYLLDDYIFTNGKIRIGKLLEDLDALAGRIAFKQIDNGDPDAAPFSIVTASMDRLDLFLPEAGIENYKLSGHVTYVGNSSMEVFIKAEIVPDDADTTKKKTESPEKVGNYNKNTVFATRFTIVAIDPVTRRPIKVNPLKLTSPAEERLFRLAEANKMRKKVAAETSLTRQPPNEEERQEIHDLFLKYSQYTDGSGDSFMGSQPLPENLVWMSNTKLESNLLMLPQDRNINHNVFGGYLMRCAYELAYANASLFMGSSSPTLLSMDEVMFKKPVHVGTLMNFSSCIVLSKGHPHQTAQVRVVAEAIDMDRGTRETTNIFHFTLNSNRDDIKLRGLLPKTYAESMLWIDAKRRRNEGILARRAMLEAGVEEH